MIFTKSKNTYFATPKDNPKDKISLEVGDSKQPDFKPQQKIMRWNNEVNVSLRLVHDELTPTVSKSGEKITWEGEKVKAEIYPLTEDEGGNEFEITLKEKPKSNVVQFTLVDKGVEYFYQPPLTEEVKVGDEDGRIVKVTETDAFDKDKNSVTHRPENVVGSYAIYASENKTNYIGGKEYKCGKVGHIFRPKIIDAEGTEVWGELHIENGILSVTIPLDFLDKAVYPVRHAAGLTFGYTTQGLSYDGLGNASSNGFYIKGSPDVNGSVTTISIYGNSNVYDPDYFKGAIFSSTTPYSRIGDAGGEVSVKSSSAMWINSSIVSNNPSVSGGTIYLIGGVLNNNIYLYKDTLSLSGTYCTANYANVTIQYRTGNSHYSVYATYTAGGASGPANLKSLNTNLKANIKSINGNLIANVKSLNTNL